MITLSPAALLGAVLLDLILGDPRWFPHPVIFIGRLIRWLETILRKLLKAERLAGVFLLVIVVSASSGTVYLLLSVIAAIHPLAAELAGMLLGYTCLASRSLHLESAKVAEAMGRGDLPGARAALSMIVGRDTDALEEPDIWRGAVETVAENSSDGVIAPLLFLMIGGPILAIAYKAVNTLDSMVGYKNDRYILFGWASARFDDLCNWLPARVTGLLIVLTAPLVGLSGSNAWRIMLRDRKNHSSPNSGVPEAAAAGALGVRLGGVNRYFGKEVAKPTIGDSLKPLNESAWQGAIRLMYASEALLVAAWLTVSVFTVWSQG
jgi:adenosylcobinamide-phosphate synthase